MSAHSDARLASYEYARGPARGVALVEQRSFLAGTEWERSRTVAELRQIADDWDREAAERTAERFAASVRCIDCDLRYEERLEYPCLVPGNHHLYIEKELAEAREPVIEPTHHADRLRQRADALSEE